MRFWFEHSGEVSLREQIVAQVTLGILSGELAPAERLPSIRELARRFRLHANTVSAGYRQLEAEGWVSSRKGSGVYVRSAAPPSPAASVSAAQVLDRMISNLCATAARLGVSPQELTERIRIHNQPRAIDRLLLVEPDPELRRIVLAELAECVGSIAACELISAADSVSALILTLPSKFDRLRAELPSARLHCLRVRSVPVSLAEHLPPPGARSGILVGIASHWPEFLRFARTMLVAAGFPADALIVRDAKETGWQHGLEQAAAVVCDLVTAYELPRLKTIVSRILAEGVADELKTALT